VDLGGFQGECFEIATLLSAHRNDDAAYPF